MFRRPLTLAFLSAVAVALLLLASSADVARGHADFGLYLWAKEGNSFKEMDPINVMFVETASLEDTLSHFAHHVGWTDDNGSKLWFEDHGVRDEQDAQRGSGSVFSNRDHIRFEQGADDDSALGNYTLAAVHREVRERRCGGPIFKFHKSIDFNGPRNDIAAAFEAGGHSVTWVNKGNTDAIAQCDGTTVSSDGSVAVISIGSGHAGLVGKSWWYGDETLGTFQAGASPGDCADERNSGMLTSPAIQLGSNPSMEFDTLWEIESVDADRFDVMQVEIVDVGSLSSTGQIAVAAQLPAGESNLPPRR